MKTNKLTEEETQVLKKKASEILSVCRRNILNKYPFIGSIALRMNMVPVRDVRVRTACTDGDSVYFDIAFLSSLSDDERVFVLAHEVWHAVLMHLVRRHNRNPQLFNIATDKEVNHMLKQDGFVPPFDLCFPEKDEVGKCAEEIYEMMLKKMPKIPKNQSGNSSSGGSGNKNGQSSGSSSQKSKKNKNSNGSNSESNDFDDDQNGGNKDGRLKGQFDRHIYDGDNSSSGSNGNQPNGNGQPNKNDGDGDEENEGNGFNGFSTITDKYGEVGLDSDYQPKVPRNFADKMRETVISEANRIEKMKGNLPAHIKSLVKKFTSAQVPWQEVLAQFVTRCYNSGNRSWISPNRRHVHNGLYLQSRQADKIRLACIIDTSGSTMGDRSTFLGELHGLIKSFSVFSLYVIECDAEVGSIKHYTQDDDLQNIIENGEYSMTGSGGTSMLPALDAIIDEQMEVDAVLLLTDGYIDNIPKNPTGLPTLWIITKDGTEDFNDWGQKIRLTRSDDDL